MRAYRVVSVATVVVLLAAFASRSDAAATDRRAADRPVTDRLAAAHLAADRPAAALARSGFVAPVEQGGARASVRGALGETWVGTIAGTSLRIVTGIRPRSVKEPSLSLVLLSPNGGEAFGTANEVAIRWELGGTGTVVVDLDWSADQGATWNEIAHDFAQEEAGSGTFTWTTPRDPVAAALVRVRASGPSATALDESDAPFAIIDDDGPLLTLGLLANPYVDRFVDLVAVANEPVSAEGLRFEIGGEVRTPTAVGDEGRVFWLDTVVDGAADSLAVRACAADLAGNEACAEGALSIIDLGEGGNSASDGGVPGSPFPPSAASASRVAWSPDRRLGVAFDDPRASAPTHRRIGILVTSPSPGTPLGTEDGGEPVRYEFLAGEPGPARLLVPLTAEDLGATAPRFAVHGPDGPVELWIDREARLAWASIGSLTTISWVPGASGSFREVTELRTEIRSIVPNPIVTDAVVVFDLPTRSPVSLSVHDVTGRRVARLLDGAELTPGQHQVFWNGTHDIDGDPAGSTRGNRRLPSGTYWLRLRTGEGESRARIVLLGQGGSR